MKGLFLLTYMGYFLPYALMIPHLEFCGITQGQRSWIFVVSAILTMVGQMAVGFLCERKNTLRKPYWLTLIIFVLSGWGCYAAASLPWVLITATLFQAAFRVNMGVLDSWALEQREYGNFHYGSIRGWGALGSILGSAAASQLWLQGGPSFIQRSVLVLGGIILAYSFRLPEVKKTTKRKPLQLSDMKCLLKRLDYRRMVMVLFFINFMANADLLTVVDKLVELKASSRLISLKWELQALCELPLFLISTSLLKRWSAEGLLKFSLLMYSLRYILASFAPNAELVVLISALQLVTFPLFQIASKILIDKRTPASMPTAGQQLALSLYSGCSMGISPLIFGVLSTLFSTNLSLLITGLLGVIPAWLLLHDKENEQVSNQPAHQNRN